MRPGASEVYTVLVECALSGHHEIKIRLRASNRVSFEGVCDRDAALAFEKLGGERTCLFIIDLMRASIRQRHVRIDIHCCSCRRLVCLTATGKCSCGEWRSGVNQPFWERIVRVGRV